MQRRKIRTRPRELGVGLAAALCLAGCGSGSDRAAPTLSQLPFVLASDLAARSDAVARALDAGDGCPALSLARRLQRRTIAAINAHRVPDSLQEPLLGRVNELPARIACGSSVSGGAAVGRARALAAWIRNHARHG